MSQVQKGATTTWEMWDAYREEPDGTYFLDGSFNHYTYGTSAGFLYTHTLGITSDENNPGFKHFYFAPHITEDLSYAGGSYESAYGLIASKWERTKDGYRFDFTVPANTTATLTLPALPDGKDYFEGKKAAVKAVNNPYFQGRNQSCLRPFIRELFFYGRQIIFFQKLF